MTVAMPFPSTTAASIVAAHHCPHGTKDWLQLPKGHDASPLIFGELIPGDRVQVFESTWDALAFLDKSGERSGVICKARRKQCKICDRISR